MEFLFCKGEEREQYVSDGRTDERLGVAGSKERKRSTREQRTLYNNTDRQSNP